MARRHRQPPLNSSDGKGAICTWCRRTLKSSSAMPSPLAATRDHVRPKSYGGERRVWCCRQCNNLKANMLVREWKRFMRDNPEWWLTFGLVLPSLRRGATALNQQEREASD